METKMLMSNLAAVCNSLILPAIQAAHSDKMVRLQCLHDASGFNASIFVKDGERFVFEFSFTNSSEIFAKADGSSPMLTGSYYILRGTGEMTKCKVTKLVGEKLESVAFGPDNVAHFWKAAIECGLIKDELEF